MPFSEPTPIPGNSPPQWTDPALGGNFPGWQQYLYGGFPFTPYTPWTGFQGDYGGLQQYQDPGNLTTIQNQDPSLTVMGDSNPQDPSYNYPWPAPTSFDPVLGPNATSGPTVDINPQTGEPTTATDPNNPFAGVVAGGDHPGTPTSGPMSPYDPSYAYGTVPGMTGPGTYQSGTYIPGGTPGNIYGTNYGSMGYSIAGVPGTYVTDPSGQTYSTSIGQSMDPNVGYADVQGSGGIKLAVPENEMGAAGKTGAHYLAQQAYLAANPLAPPGPEYISGWQWYHDPYGGLHGSPAGGNPNVIAPPPGGPGTYSGGYYYPIYSPGIGTNVPMPTGKPGSSLAPSQPPSNPSFK